MKYVKDIKLSDEDLNAPAILGFGQTA